MTKEEVQKRIEELKKHKRIMKEYLQLWVDEDDHHSVWDAAVDLARICDEIETLEKFL